MKNYFSISNWLLTIMIFIVIIVMVGGITRLTESGLSIVDWHPVSGVFPPLNEMQWKNEFNQYKLYPEYQLKNTSLTLNEFKRIFWWEYIHRMLGRIIGLIAIIPYIFLLVQKKLTKIQKRNYFMIIALISIQGVLGWIMVKSGLNSETYNGLGVSHFYLTIHLSLALITFCYTFWQYLQLKKQYFLNSSYEGFNIGTLLTFLLFLQIVLGGLLAGLNGGLVSKTYPLMNGEFYPSNANFSFYNPFFIHFLHRWFPLIILAISLYLYFNYKKAMSSSQIAYFRLFFYIFFMQAILGVFSIILSIPIQLAVIHQLGGVFILSVSVLLTFSFNNK